MLKVLQIFLFFTWVKHFSLAGANGLLSAFWWLCFNNPSIWSIALVIILYSVNFIAVCEAVDRSCRLSSSPPYLSSSGCDWSHSDRELPWWWSSFANWKVIDRSGASWLGIPSANFQPLWSLQMWHTTSYEAGVRMMVWMMRRASGSRDFSDSSQAERFGNRAVEAKSFIVIPHGGAVQQPKCLLSVPLKVSNNKSPG